MYGYAKSPDGVHAAKHDKMQEIPRRPFPICFLFYRICLPVAATCTQMDREIVVMLSSLRVGCWLYRDRRPRKTKRGVLRRDDAPEYAVPSIKEGGNRSREMRIGVARCECANYAERLS